MTLKSDCLLKKPSVAFSTSTFEKRGFRKSLIFNGLQPSIMAVHPCTALSWSKNFVFQQADKRIAEKEYQ